jgi:signal transduction histidine kinase
MRLRELLRTTSFRLSSLYGLIFALGLAGLLGLVYLRSAVYLTHRVDSIMSTEAAALSLSPASDLEARIGEAQSLTGDKTSVFALFTPSGARLVGNLPVIPPGLRPNGPPVEIAATPLFPAPARLIARRLASGEILVVGRDINQLQEMRAILASALIWSGAAIAVIGLACAVGLSIGPVRRLRVLEDACREIAGGNLTRRLPISRGADEIDTFAATVNYMMDEVERLMGEVKGSTETIAHDLRTPLTRARARLHRLQQSPTALAADLARVTAELDTVLERFRALMRISELEARERRRGFARIDAAHVLADVFDLYQPLAEDNGVALTWSAPPDVALEADPKLLFEAVSNLVDNAIKFSGAGGSVSLRLEPGAGPPRIVVEDDGPGIPVAEKSAVLQRFYRGERDRMTPGSGLGLSIASAITRLHGFHIELEDASPGLRAVIVCGRGETLFTGSSGTRR